MRRPEEGMTMTVRDLLAWGVAAYPMRYQPLKGEHAFTKDSYISPNWTAEQLNMVAAARRVIGYGGAFPAYEGLVKKCATASGFEDAFGLRPRKDGADEPPIRRQKSDFDGFELREFAWDLIRMGKDHQFPVAQLKRLNRRKKTNKTAAAIPVQMKLWPMVEEPRRADSCER